MMRMGCVLRWGLHVVRTANGPAGTPLPHMDMFLLTDGKGNKKSFWNDVGFRMEGDTVTCCIEIPKEVCNKMEVIKEEPFHPIMQDTKKNMFSK